jgi:hypothetical protein
MSLSEPHSQRTENRDIEGCISAQHSHLCFMAVRRRPTGHVQTGPPATWPRKLAAIEDAFDGSGYRPSRV